MQASAATAHLDDLALLRDYAARRNADAFAELVRRYAALAYGVGLRITGNDADAQDVVQECFLQLAAQSDRVALPLAAWLHTLARSRAIDLTRRRQARRRNERQALRHENSPLTAQEWESLSAQVDEVIAALDDELRLPLIGLYLQGRTQQELAEELGISQGTVSRRIERAVEQLREQLRQRGVDVPMSSLAFMLPLMSAQAQIPASAVANLLKMGLCGIGDKPIPPPGSLALRTFSVGGLVWSVIGAALLAAGLAGLFYWQDHPKQTRATTTMPTTNPQEQNVNPRVAREGGKVWTTQIPELRWGKTGNTTLIGALNAAITPTDHPYTYSMIQASCGMAFRVRWYRGLDGKSWSGASPIAEVGEEPAAITRATGWALDWKPIKPGTDPLPEIHRSIDQGLCVLGYVRKHEADMGLIYGYEEDDTRLLVSSYYVGNTAVPAADAHDVLAFLKYQGNAMSTRDALLQGIRMGVGNWHRGAVPAEDIFPWVADGKAVLWYGDSAYAQWIGDLQHFNDLDESQRANLFHCSGWAGQCLYDSRNWGGRWYLKENAALFDGPVKEALLHASDLYGQIADLVIAAIKTDKAFVSLGNVKHWTPQLRAREIDVLTQSRQLDAQAIAELEKALSALSPPK